MWKAKLVDVELIDLRWNSHMLDFIRALKISYLQSTCILMLKYAWRVILRILQDWQRSWFVIENRQLIFTDKVCLCELNSECNMFNLILTFTHEYIMCVLDRDYLIFIWSWPLCMNILRIRNRLSDIYLSSFESHAFTDYYWLHV